MTYALRLGALFLATAVITPAVVLAKPACNAVSTTRAAMNATVETKNMQTIQGCRDECVAEIGHREAPVSKVPSTTHLPLLSTPDEIADWHAEIFDRLSQRDDGTVFCKVDTPLSSINAI